MRLECKVQPLGWTSSFIKNFAGEQSKVNFFTFSSSPGKGISQFIWHTFVAISKVGDKPA